MRLKSHHLLVAGLLFAAFYYYPLNYWRSVWWDKWFLVSTACVGFFAVRLSQRFGWLAALSVGYVLMSALWVMGWKDAYAGIALQPLLALGKISGYSFATVLLISSTLLLLEKDAVKWVGASLGVIAMGNALYTIYQYFVFRDQALLGGLFGNPSISGCYTAFVYPLMLASLKYLPIPKKDARWHGWAFLAVIIIPPVSVFLPGASVPMFTLACVCLGQTLKYALHNHKLTRARVIRVSVYTALILVAFVILGSLLSYHRATKGGLFSDSGRSFIWKIMIKSWWETGNIWVGQGTGTSQLLTPMTQQEWKNAHPEYPMTDLWLWFHSDIIQSLFENGVIGFTLLMLTLGEAFKRAWRKRGWVFSSLCGLTGAAAINFPAHFPLHAFAGAFILAGALYREESK